MSLFTRILAGTDGSACAEIAEHYAIRFAEVCRARLRFVHAVDEAYLGFVVGELPNFDIGASLGMLREQARRHLEGVTARAAALGIEAESEVRTGKPAAAILDSATEMDADLIVVGTHGRSGLTRFVFGSAAEAVLRHAAAPVLVVRHFDDIHIADSGGVTIRTVLCPIDFSPSSMAALPVAQALCRELGAALVLLHVVDTRSNYPTLIPVMTEPHAAHLQEEAARRIHEIAGSIRGIEVRAELCTGVPHDEIHAASHKDRADLVVMATHGHTGITHAVLGSTTERVVRRASCPVLTMRPAVRTGAGERAWGTQGEAPA